MGNKRTIAFLGVLSVLLLPVVGCAVEASEIDPSLVPDDPDETRAIESEYWDNISQTTGGYWSPWTSEEFAPVECQQTSYGAQFILKSVECQGSYCDNVRIHCEQVAKSPASALGETVSPWFEDNGVGEYICPQGYWVTKLGCDGNWCDNIKVRCSNTGRTASNCSWSGPHSEEYPNPYHAPSGKYIRGIRCSGTHCDDKRYYTCTLN